MDGNCHCLNGNGVGGLSTTRNFKGATKIFTMHISSLVHAYHITYTHFLIICTVPCTTVYRRMQQQRDGRACCAWIQKGDRCIPLSRADGTDEGFPEGGISTYQYYCTQCTQCTRYIVRTDRCLKHAATYRYVGLLAFKYTTCTPVYTSVQYTCRAQVNSYCHV